MLFHLGALWRLNEAGLLSRLRQVSSVSGGSITAGVLASRWSRLAFDGSGVATQFGREVVAPVRALAGKTIDWRAVVGGVLQGGRVAEQVAAYYRRYLFANQTLQDLLPPPAPNFWFNATNMQTGALWRFSRAFMADWHVGVVPHPHVELATVVAASSAFPPFLSPLHLDLKPEDFTPLSGFDLQRPPYTRRALLADGGVYDNLGLETAWKHYQTILISNGGGKMSAKESLACNWFSQSRRVIDLIDNQVRSLRARGAIAAYRDNTRSGAYWGIWTAYAKYPTTSDELVCPAPATSALAGVSVQVGVGRQGRWRIGYSGGHE